MPTAVTVTNPLKGSNEVRLPDARVGLMNILDGVWLFLVSAALDACIASLQRHSMTTGMT
jgi:hypothetical protein